jgi:hypothetical protein
MMLKTQIEGAGEAAPTIAATIAAAGSARAVCEKLKQEIEDLNRFIRLGRAH